jgi:hypothetical protein
MSTIVLDIETIPAAEADANPDAIREMAARREQDPATFASLCPPLARVVAVGMVHPSSGRLHIVYDSSLLDLATPREDAAGCDGEQALLTRIAEILGERGVSRIVTFGGRGFDIPTLIHRMRINGVPVPGILKNAAWQKPWEDVPHVDVLGQCTFGGASGRYSLRAYALAYGLEDPKAEIGGENVLGVVLRRDGDTLCRYLEGDVRTTAALWARVAD